MSFFPKQSVLLAYAACQYDRLCKRQSCRELHHRRSVVDLTSTLGNSFGPALPHDSRPYLQDRHVGDQRDFRLHLYQSPPVPANGDGGAWLTTKAADWPAISS